MSNADFAVTKDGYKYEVFFDYHEDISDIDFETEEQRLEYRRKFESGELTAYEVTKSTPCKCCDSWIFVDGMCGIHAENFEQAIEYFIEGNIA
jgi:hypothetical protein